MTAVNEYDDIKAGDEMTASDRDAVARCLQSGLQDDDLVAFIPDWLREENDIGAVIEQPIEHETEKAYLVEIHDRDVWLPKSVITRFTAEPGTVIAIPQRGLGEFAGESNA